LSTYKAVFSYNGYRYEGWQIQPHTEKTVQGQINKALSKITKTDDIRTMGSGRTDSGVHALAQTCKMTLPFFIECDSLLRAINSHLPRDIRCLEIIDCPSDFHPVREALWKTYDYIVYTGDILSPLLNTRVTPFSYKLDFAEMQKALKELEGERDFKNFSTKGTEVSSTIRTLLRAELVRPAQHSFDCLCLDESFLHFRFTGTGFLKQMVRLLVSSVLDCGRGRISSNDISKFLLKQTDLKIAPTAKPDGLYLSHVEYKDAWSPVIDKRLQSR